MEHYRTALEEFFPGGPDVAAGPAAALRSPEYPHIISEKHFKRLVGLLENQRVLLGGGYDAGRLAIEPTLLDETDPDSPVMQEEIFGPILPVITYECLDECIEFIRSRPRPLALYLFTTDKATERRILDSCSFGGGCINDTIMHLASPHLPFGGVGASGMGSYHGKKSFDTFTHYRSVLRQSSRIDLPVRYHPYKESWFKLVRKLLH